MTFQKALELYRNIYRRFEAIEQRKWGVEGAMIELVKQVGDLAKHVMVAEKYYYTGREQRPSYRGDKQAIADELADIFGQLIRISDYYGIDLERAHVAAREAEDRALCEKGA